MTVTKQLRKLADMIDKQAGDANMKKELKTAQRTIKQLTKKQAVHDKRIMAALRGAQKANDRFLARLGKLVTSNGATATKEGRVVQMPARRASKSRAA